MTLTIIFSGQIAHAAGCTERVLEVEAGASLERVLLDLAAGLPGEAASFLQDQTLLLAVDGEHVIDRAFPLPDNAREVLVMSPMSGG